MLAEDIEFKATHPWLVADGHVGNMSDGASDYSSAYGVLYYLLNPHLNAKCISVEGMGKDEIDRDYGSEQGKLRTARANSDLTFTGQYIKACNARRHKGAINARVELDTSLDIASAETKKDQTINRIGELKLYDTRSASQPRSWELFSRKLSEVAGRPVGFGRRRAFSRAVLREKHALDAHRLPAFGAELNFPEEDSLDDSEESQHNVAPCLSRAQRSDAAVAAKAKGEEKATRAERKQTAKQSAVQFCSVLHVKSPSPKARSTCSATSITTAGSTRNASSVAVSMTPAQSR